MARFAAVLGALLCPAIACARVAAAQPPPAAASLDPDTGEAASAGDEPRLLEPVADELEKAAPPPRQVVYFQYGVAFAAEQVVAPGPICASDQVPCILGAGGGIVVRAGWRSSGPLYLGAAYQVTKQDPNKLYRLALLQQARAEARYYFMTARVTEPYVTASAGVGGYGNEWSIDTWGPAGSIGAGLEYQVTRRTVVGVALAYQLLHFSRFTDTAGSARPPGIAQLVGLDFVLEQRDAILTSAPGQR